jgi:hypothetical protein
MNRLAGVTAVSVMVLAGCGGSDDSSTTAASTSTVPAELVGTYERTVVEGESGQAPAGVWKLAIGPVGEFFLVPPGATGFFNSPVAVDGDQLMVPADPTSGCTGVGTYTYVAASPRPRGRLMLTLVSDDLCPDRASLLSSGPFTATD